MKILSMQLSHDASACILENGKIIYYKCSERITRIKHDSNPLPIISDIIKNKYLEFDTIIITYLDQTYEENYYENLNLILKEIQKFKFNELKVTRNNHHLYHAFCSLYTCGVDDAVVVILDGSGSSYKEGNNLFLERDSIYCINQKEKKYQDLHKNYYCIKEECLKQVSPEHFLSCNSNNKILENSTYKNVTIEPSVGFKFSIASVISGFTWFDAGKIMGLSQFYKYKDKIDKQWSDKVDLAHQCQTETELEVLDIIKKAIKYNKSNNIILTGGYALNCVANSKILDIIPKDYNFYVDPICFDAGISIGAAYYEFFKSSSFKISKNESIYLCDNEDDYTVLSEFNTKDTSYGDIINLIEEGNVVAVYQGKSESGQRALGNRSLLFDPRVANGKDIVNSVKKRESFRPFACTIIEEFAEDWFETKGLKQAPYMQFAFKCKSNLIPAVVHIDNTSRIQTINKHQNYHFYKLIETFYLKTGIPILGNTSFNLAGDPLVENLQDAINTLKNSNIEFLYLPEIQKLIYFKNEQIGYC
jgi:carbamoyltransferase